MLVRFVFGEETVPMHLSLESTLFDAISIIRVRGRSHIHNSNNTNLPPKPMYCYYKNAPLPMFFSIGSIFASKESAFKDANPVIHVSLKPVETSVQAGLMLFEGIQALQRRPEGSQQLVILQVLHPESMVGAAVFRFFNDRIFFNIFKQPPTEVHNIVDCFEFMFNAGYFSDNASLGPQATAFVVGVKSKREGECSKIDKGRLVSFVSSITSYPWITVL